MIASESMNTSTGGGASVGASVENNTLSPSSESFDRLPGGGAEVSQPSAQSTSTTQQKQKVSNNPPSSSSSNRPTNNQQDTVPLSFLKFEDVEPYFDLRLEDACEKLGISTTSMKKICRQWYIQRWPHRKLKSLQSKQQKIQKQLNDDASEDAEKKLSLYVRLRLEEQLKNISDEITQIRSKNTYEERRMRDNGHHGSSFDSSSSSNHGSNDVAFYSPHMQPQQAHTMPMMHSPQFMATHNSASPNMSATSAPLVSPFYHAHSPYLSPQHTPQNVYHPHQLSSHHSSPYHNSIQSHTSPLISPHLSSHMSHLNLSSFQLNPEAPSTLGTSSTAIPAFGSQQQYVSEYRSSAEHGGGASSPKETHRAGGILSGLRDQQQQQQVASHPQFDAPQPPPTALSEPQRSGAMSSGTHLPSFQSLMQSLDRGMTQY